MTAKLFDAERVRRQIAAEFGETMKDDDPLMIAAAIAALVTRDTIAQEREKNADNQLLSVGDVRTVLLDVRDQTIEVTNQIVGVIWMQIQEGLEERVSQLLGDANEKLITRLAGYGFVGGIAVGVLATAIGLTAFWEG